MAPWAPPRCKYVFELAVAQGVVNMKPIGLAAIYADWIAEEILRAQETDAGWARAGPSRGGGRTRSTRHGPHAGRRRSGAR